MSKVSLLHDVRFWRIAGQFLLIMVVTIAISILADNFHYNLERQGREFGFDFLEQQTSFDIGETLIPYQPTDVYWVAILVGILNSLRIIVFSTIFSTLIGVIVGIARLSDNWLVRKLAFVYVEIIRNTPLLLQLFFCYFVIFLSLPQPENSISWFGIIVFSNRGIDFGSLHLSSEFSALLLGLTIYTAGFIAEIVRGGIQSVPKGQSEAARALGLKPGLAMRLVILPQALRVIVPSLNSEYLNLAKNSSLAIAIAYPDIYSICSTTLNQTGRDVEVILLLMVIYLTINLIISVLMNLFNQTVQLKER